MAITVAIGPEKDSPSWRWIGQDMAKELRKRYAVCEFNTDALPRAQVIIYIKALPSIDHFRRLKEQGSRVIYLPIDHFRSRLHIARSGRRLRLCDLIAVHSPDLLPYFRRFSVTTSVDHHGRFFLPEISAFKESGYALWIGAVQHLPFLLLYLRSNRVPIAIRLLTDRDNGLGRKIAIEQAKSLGIEMDFRDHQINGLDAFVWSPQLQAEMMCQAKAAIDIKGSDFNQLMKPPTKAQQFVCSGIPLAMNPSGPVRYFRQLGLAVPEPTDSSWLTVDYYMEVSRIAASLRIRLTAESVGAEFCRLVEIVTRGARIVDSALAQ
jgi:hypothetical protein